jgi:hypothetical protein
LSYFFNPSANLIDSTLSTGRFRDGKYVEVALSYSKGLFAFLLGNGNGYLYLLRGNWLSPSAYDSAWRLVFIDYGLLGLVSLGFVVLRICFIQFSRLFSSHISLRILRSYIIVALLLVTFTNEFIFMDALAPQFFSILVFVLMTNETCPNSSHPA